MIPVLLAPCRQGLQAKVLSQTRMKPSWRSRTLRKDFGLHPLPESSEVKARIDGFTLIEMMVVILIIGITLSFAFIAFGDFGESRRLVFAAEQLANSLELAQQQAILETSTLGLRLDNRGYQILKFNEKGWQPLANKGIFKMNYFPQNALIALNIPFSASQPNIILNASGEMTPFVLHFGTNQNPKVATLIGKHNGNLFLNTGQSQ